MFKSKIRENDKVETISTLLSYVWRKMRTNGILQICLITRTARDRSKPYLRTLSKPRERLGQLRRHRMMYDVTLFHASHWNTSWGTPRFLWDSEREDMMTSPEAYIRSDWTLPWGQTHLWDLIAWTRYQVSDSVALYLSPILFISVPYYMYYCTSRTLVLFWVLPSLSTVGE